MTLCWWSTQWTHSSNENVPLLTAPSSKGYFKMSLRAKSHTDLQMAGKSSADDSLYKSFTMSSSNVNDRGSRFGNGAAGEVKVLSRPSRRPVRAVRPVSAIGSSSSFIQINHLHGELVRKRKVRVEREKGGVLWSEIGPEKQHERFGYWWTSGRYSVPILEHYNNHKLFKLYML